MWYVHAVQLTKVTDHDEWSWDFAGPQSNEIH